MVTTQDGTQSLKPKADWSNDEDDESHGNYRALKSIFRGVDKNVFCLINTCTEGKKASEILKTTHEGTSKVRMSRLQHLNTNFENLRMEKDITILTSMFMFVKQQIAHLLLVKKCQKKNDQISSKEV